MQPRRSRCVEEAPESSELPPPGDPRAARGDGGQRTGGEGRRRARALPHRRRRPLPRAPRRRVCWRAPNMWPTRPRRRCSATPKTEQETTLRDGREPRAKDRLYAAGDARCAVDRARGMQMLRALAPRASCCACSRRRRGRRADVERWAASAGYEEKPGAIRLLARLRVVLGDADGGDGARETPRRRVGTEGVRRRVVRPGRRSIRAARYAAAVAGSAAAPAHCARHTRSARAVQPPRRARAPPRADTPSSRRAFAAAAARRPAVTAAARAQARRRAGDRRARSSRSPSGGANTMCVQQMRTASGDALRPTAPTRRRSCPSAARRRDGVCARARFMEQGRPHTRRAPAGRGATVRGPGVRGSQHAPLPLFGS